LPRLLQNTWDCILCKTAKRGGVKRKERTWRNGTFSTGIYSRLASSLDFATFVILQITRQMLTIYWKYCIIQNTRQI
jgi:hypothetical protein